MFLKIIPRNIEEEEGHIWKKNLKTLAISNRVRPKEEKEE